jgi:hypothetical protein
MFDVKVFCHVVNLDFEGLERDLSQIGNEIFAASGLQ